MKRIVLMLAMIFSFAAVAQEVENKPKLEKEGEKIKATFFHDNGEVAQTGYYLDGKLHGEWKSYDEKGNKTAMAQYEHGKKTGKWFFWSDDVLKEVNYDDNRITNVTEWSNSNPVVVTD
ncbi:nicotinic acid mononucleotide adenyltransferase [Galbibacter sp. EGI 63066]|uniref:toxin-antitoxin system YwqK family antitoxin n=1 Tax=Galbibacter sp. EGI 63066 TaxID=2993559 RepID=UPI0022495FC6|nr:nicotinic acid mononucleotide adenyltransferase [Galbibacter sp. EGI 63066]MCX2681295.1 nicotinic acid mononucleotide adenyltransferase [Galbibacter sp. EGI 63066]